MDLTSWHTPRTLKKSGLNLADFSVASQDSERICRICRLFIFDLPSMRIVTEEVWRYVVLFQLTLEEKGRWQVRNYDGGDHDPKRRSNGLPRKAMPTIHSSSIRSGVRH